MNDSHVLIVPNGLATFVTSLNLALSLAAAFAPRSRCRR